MDNALNLSSFVTSRMINQTDCWIMFSMSCYIPSLINSIPIPNPSPNSQTANKISIPNPQGFILFLAPTGWISLWVWLPGGAEQSCFWVWLPSGSLQLSDQEEAEAQHARQLGDFGSSGDQPSHQRTAEDRHEETRLRRQHLSAPAWSSKAKQG